MGRAWVLQLPPDSPRGPWGSQLLVPSVVGGNQYPELAGTHLLQAKAQKPPQLHSLLTEEMSRNPVTELVALQTTLVRTEMAWGHEEGVVTWASSEASLSPSLLLRACCDWPGRAGLGRSQGSLRSAGS